MLSREYDFQLTEHKTIHLWQDTFTSTQDIVNCVSHREPRYWMLEDDAFLSDKGASRPSDPGWSGFRSKTELKGLIANGLNDTKFIKDTIKYAHSAVVQEKDKYRTMRRRVAGGAVCVPAYLADVPACMWCPTKVKTDSKIVKLALDIGVLCDVSKSDYETAGQAVARTICKLEQAGYRVRFHTVMTTTSRNGHPIEDRQWEREHGDSERVFGGIIFHQVVKTEGQPMNYAKMLYPVCSTSYWRGLGFSWLASHPHMGPDSGLGRGIHDNYWMWGCDSVETEERLIDQVCGPGFTPIVYSDLVDMISHGKSREDVEKVLEAKLMKV